MANIYLFSAIPGKTYKVAEIAGGHGMQKRLQDLGIVQGTELEVIQNDTRHPLLIKTNGTVLMIGKGIAKKISAFEVSDMQRNGSNAVERKLGDNQCHL